MENLKQQLDEKLSILKTSYEEKVEDLEKRLELALGNDEVIIKTTHKVSNLNASSRTLIKQHIITWLTESEAISRFFGCVKYENTGLDGICWSIR